MFYWQVQFSVHCIKRGKNAGWPPLNIRKLKLEMSQESTCLGEDWKFQYINLIINGGKSRSTLNLQNYKDILDVMIVMVCAII